MEKEIENKYVSLYKEISWHIENYGWKLRSSYAIHEALLGSATKTF